MLQKKFSAISPHSFFPHKNFLDRKSRNHFYFGPNEIADSRNIVIADDQELGWHEA